VSNWLSWLSWLCLRLLSSLLLVLVDINLCIILVTLEEVTRRLLLTLEHLTVCWLPRHTKRLTNHVDLRLKH
jgi:hypothetical protein